MLFCVYVAFAANGRKVDAVRHANKVMASIVVGLTLSLYPLSVGPVFRYECESVNAASPWCRYYKPLFVYCPDLTLAYLRMWGISEVEAYVLLSASISGNS